MAPARRLSYAAEVERGHAAERQGRGPKGPRAENVRVI